MSKRGKAVPQTLTRREALRLAPGAFALGVGLGATLRANEASAATPAYELRFSKKQGDKLVQLDAIPLPPEVARQIESGDADKIEFVWYVRRDKSKKKLARHAAPGRDAVAKKRPRKKKK